MKGLLLVLCCLLAALACSEQPTDSMRPEAVNDFSLQTEFTKALQGQKVFTDRLLGGCPPMPLPEVEFKIGQVMSGLGRVRVPVFMSDQYPSNGMLLSVKYDSKFLTPVDIEPGPAWDHADFVHAIGNPVKGIDLWIWLILGWELQDGAAVPLPTERLQEPMAFMVFEVIKPGKGHIVWDPLPDPAPVFYRRAEALVTIDECDWDVVDWYKSSPNSTGKVTVQPGYVIGTGR